jgi:hypothetical protein
VTAWLILAGPLLFVAGLAIFIEWMGEHHAH